jgi:hypothetical protein
LVNLLNAASLEAYPMLVSERFHGKVNADYPFIDQFNSVFAYVPINNKKYYLDATDKTIPPHLTPFNILNTTAFIVNRKAGENLFRLIYNWPRMGPSQEMYSFKAVTTPG